MGRAELLAEGSDVLFVAAGRMVEIAEKAGADLTQRGASVGVVNARWVKPLDQRIVDWAVPVKHVVTLEDNVVAGGFGSAVMEAFALAGVPKSITCIGVPDLFLPFGSPGDVMEWAGMDADSIVARVSALLSSS